MTGVFSIDQGIQRGERGPSKVNTGVEDAGKDVSVMESSLRSTLPCIKQTLETIPEEPRRSPKIIIRWSSKTPSPEEDKKPSSKIILRQLSKTPSEEEVKVEPVKKKTIIKLKSPVKKTPSAEVKPAEEPEAEPIKKKTMIKLKVPAEKTPSSEDGSILEPLRPSLLPRPRREPSPPPGQASPVAPTSTQPAHSYGLRSRRPRVIQS